MKSRFYIITLLIIFGFTSCYEDKGNYNYDTLTTVKIEGIPDPCNAFSGTNLKIPVNITYENGELTDVSYEWRVEGKVISTDKDLDILVNFETKPGQYADFSVIDNKTGIRTIKTFTMNVTTEFSKGWLILSDNIDHSELSFIRYDGELYQNIYEKLNNEQLSPGAVCIKEHWLPWSGVNGEIFIGIPNGPNYSVEIDGNSLMRMVYSKDEFLEGKPDNFAPVNFDAVMNWDYMISNKKLYTRYVRSGLDAKYHEGRFVRLPVPGTYELSNITLRGNVVFSNDIIAFDNLSKSYKLIRNGEMDNFNYDNDPNKKFKPFNMGKTLLAGGAISVATPTDNFITILKGDDNQYYVQKFKFSGWSNKSYTSLEELIFPNPELITQDTHWAICQNRPYVYFNSGNKLYAYNHTSNTIKELKGTTFKGNIRTIAINPTNYEELAIAVENPEQTNKCDFMLLNVSVVEDGKIIEGSLKEDILGNITNITYKVGSQWDIQ